MPWAVDLTQRHTVPRARALTRGQTRKEPFAMPTTARQRWTALTLLAAIEFMILLDTAIVNIALPAIKTGLHFSEADLPWIQNAYLLVFGGFLLLGGRAADLFGRKRFYLIGLGLFTASSHGRRAAAGAWAPGRRRGDCAPGGA